MNILILNAFEQTAATTIRLNHLAKRLSNNHNIIFVTFARKPNMLKNKNIKYIIFKNVLPSPFYHFWQMILKLYVSLREDYDIIYVSKPLPWALFPGIIAKFIKNKKIVLDWDEYEYAIISLVSKCKPYLAIMRAIEKFGVRSADSVVVVSPFLKKLAIEWGKSKIKVVQNGVDKEFKATISPGDIRNKFKLTGKIVMFVGALRPQFDIDLVLEAMPYVKKEVNNAQLVLVGEGNYKKNLIRLAEDLRINDYTHFLGYQPYNMIPSFIRAADVVVAPNRDNLMNRSRSPVKIAEYMSVGIPMVANSVGLAEEMLKDSGLLVKSDSPKEMAHQIIKILKDKKLANKLAARAKQRAKLYSWDKLGKELDYFISA